MFELILPTYKFGLTYAEKLIADIPDEKLCAQPVPGIVMNHGAWNLGHLAWAHGNVLRFLAQEPKLAEWKDLFSMGTKPLPDRSAYPAKEKLLAAYAETHADLLAAAQAATPAVLAGETPERMRARFPTVGHLVAGMMTGHLGNHLGQMSAWRRAVGYPSVF